METHKNIYKTSSLPIACTLSMLYPIYSIDKSDPKRVLFIFEHTTGIEKTIGAYWDGSLKVEPQAYFNQLKTLKGRIYGDE